MIPISASLNALYLLLIIYLHMLRTELMLRIRKINHFGVIDPLFL